MFRIQLKEFEGPLDLLLFLIQRDEVDIFDIPIARITDEYLAHVRQMAHVDLNGVAEFLYLASLLVSIKVRMLLPQPEADSEEELIDPRQELVARLLEYQRYKEAAHKLVDQQAQRAVFFTRGQASASEFAEGSETLVNTTVYDLISALRRVLTDAPEEPVLAIDSAGYSVEKQRRYVLQAVENSSGVAFTTLVHLRSRKFVIATFLAILEMVQRGQLVILSVLTDNDFMIGLGAANGQ